MKRYKEEVDALHASDTLKAEIASMPQSAKPKRRNVRRIAAIAAVLVVVLVAGTAATPMLFGATKNARAEEIAYDDYSYSDYAYEDYDSEGVLNDSSAYQSAAASPREKSGAADKTPLASPALPSGRKLIRNAELSVQTKTFDEFHAAVLQKTAALGGYVESSDVGSFSKLRYEHLTLRIPADSLDVFLESVAGLGTVTNQETSVQDVTDKYIDVKSRLAAMEAEQETLLALLKKAENLTEILEIQDRLAQVRGSLESYKAQLQALDSQIDYSTVTMVVNEVERVTPQEQKGFFAEVRQNLAENMYSIGQGARNFALWFLSSLPYIVLWIILIGAFVAVVLLVRRRRKRR